MRLWLSLSTGCPLCSHALAFVRRQRARKSRGHLVEECVSVEKLEAELGRAWRHRQAHALAEEGSHLTVQPPCLFDVVDRASVASSASEAPVGQGSAHAGAGHELAAAEADWQVLLVVFRAVGSTALRVPSQNCNAQSRRAVGTKAAEREFSQAREPGTGPG